MAVAFDAVGPSSAGASSTASTSLTWSHTCTGSNLCLIVGVAMGKGTDTGITTTATYNSVSMTSLGVVHNGGGTAGYTQMWYLANPASGANTVAITASGGTPGTLAGGSVSFTGVDQVTPVGTGFPGASAGAGTSLSVSVTGTTSGNFLVSTLSDGSGGEVATTGTKRWNVFVDANSGAGSAAMSTLAAPGGTQAMSWTANNDFLGEVAVEVKAAGAAAGPDRLPFMRPPGRISPVGRLIAFVGDATATSGTTNPVSLSGTVTSTGALTRQDGKALAGTAASAGSLARQDGKAVAGSVTSAGAVAKQTQKPLAGTVTSSGALATLRLRVLTVAGTIASAGALTRQDGKAVAGTITSAGVLSRQVQKVLAGTITSAGAESNIRARLIGVAGSVASAGALARQSGKALAGTVTAPPSGIRDGNR